MLIAGVDEAGRGPLAGPVTVSAVILNNPIEGLDDSKKLTEKKRLGLLKAIKAEALAWSVVHISVAEIDALNILQATMLGMQKAVNSLNVTPDKVLVDGNKVPNLKIKTEAIIGGDGIEPAISAASILAKCARDQLMIEIDKKFPGYGFAQHKGYGTQFHKASIYELGPCIHHRKTFAPVRQLLGAGLSKK